MIYQTLFVSCANHTYPIYVGYDILANEDILSSHIHGHQVLIVTQENIAQYYLPSLLQHLQRYQSDVVYLPQGEQYKNIQEWQKIIDSLLEQQHERSTTLIALGGGVIGDMTGFAAACYQRGVNYIQIPTSLIAQVDSAVGGKTGVNHPLGKNMLGAFHQPRCVISDVSLLASLPDREFISGLAEVVKYGLIADKDFFIWLENNVTAILNRDREALLTMVAHSVAAKANIVQQDEKDHELRNLLNLGHTFGHALETMFAYQDILHGEAVAIGIVMAAELSVELGFLQACDVNRIENLLTAFGLKMSFPRRREPVEIDSYLRGNDMTEFLGLLKRDKKVLNQKQNFIVLYDIGKAGKVSDIEELKVVNAIKRVKSEIFCG